ncbi:hypothetical protein WMY93_013403 [Mugilogobius chulae]|uniref:Uncharacterized protein n=1 Tax=Mugilogobius chulae TaxID=88201 RepID=A0AAW0P9Y0_9GOBI
MRIHVNLAIALLLVNMHFLPNAFQGVWKFSWPSPWFCFYLAIALHFSLLTSFCWMGIEGFHLYLLLVKVFNIYIKNYLLKACILGWGVPVIIVSIVAIVNKDVYGSVPMDNTNSTEMCFVVDEVVKTVTTLGLFGLLFLFNISILMVTIRNILKMRKGKQFGQNDCDRFKKDICTLLGVITLLGITWGLIFFSYGALTTSGLYAFTILNSLQGLFILVWFILSALKLRKASETSTLTHSSQERSNKYERFEKDSREEERIGTVSYNMSDQFEIEPVNISSVVIRLELPGDESLQNLNPPIEMVFRNIGLSMSENDSVFACHYFDDKVDLEWKTHGCKTIQRDNNIICSCNHMTPFAVLLIRAPIDEIHWQILSYISYIGCGLSAFFTALSIATYVFSHKKVDQSIAIHVSLSGALFLLNTAFLLTEWGARVKPDWVCVLVAAVMHYALLCSFTWMALEAVTSICCLLKCSTPTSNTTCSKCLSSDGVSFKSTCKIYSFKIVQLMLFFGIPAIIVSVSVGVKDSAFYGVTETTMADSNQTSAICWIKDDSYFYSVNLVYFTLIFMFNSGILVAVASSICKMKQVFKNSKGRKESKENKWRDSNKFNDSCKSGLTVLGLTCLMGTTWGLAFLGSGFVNYPVLYLFCIFNSAQGFFIFIWICLSTTKQRKREMEDKMTQIKTSTTKTE